MSTTAHKLNLSSLTLILFQIGVMIEKDRTGILTFDDVYAQIERATIFSFLEQRFGPSADFSLLTTSTWDQGKLALEALQGAAAALEGRERRKTGIESNGLALLLALTTEAIQQKFCKL